MKLFDEQSKTSRGLLHGHCSPVTHAATNYYRTSSDEDQQNSGPETAAPSEAEGAALHRR